MELSGCVMGCVEYVLIGWVCNIVITCLEGEVRVDQVDAFQMQLLGV